MKILLIGSGGREHALAWALARSPRVTEIAVAPGNGGTATTDKCTNVALDPGDLAGLRAFARHNKIDLTVVGPEAPLVAGIVDEFEGDNLPIFGPPRAAARLEGLKAHAKAFMQQLGIPTARAAIFSEFEPAAAHLETLDTLPVIKASGLASGKGVLLPDTRAEARAALRAMLVDGAFGGASAEVLLEERLSGPELSVLAFCDGTHLAVMPAAQDHKRLGAGDTGPNTGGMGAFAPAPLATPTLIEEVLTSVLRPTVAALAASGTPYRGVLYAGLMLTESGPSVLEFNCRFGDPEAQAILPLLQSDLLDVLQACVAGDLAGSMPRWRSDSAITVVLASGGYPGSYATGYPIHGLDAHADQTLVFQAGTATTTDGQIVTSGGRVLAVTGLGADLDAAARRAYKGVDAITFQDQIYRHDIGAAATGANAR